MLEESFKIQSTNNHTLKYNMLLQKKNQYIYLFIDAIVGGREKRITSILDHGFKHTLNECQDGSGSY